MKQQNISDSVIAATLKSSTQPKCVAEAYDILGLIKEDKNDFDSAMYFFKQAETLLKQTGCGDSVLIKIYGDIAMLFYKKGDFANAQVYSLQLLHIAERIGDVYQTAIANTMVSQLFNEINQTEKALVYARNAGKLLPAVKNIDEKKFLLYTLSKRYLWYYEKTRNTGSLDTSKLYGFDLLKLAQQTNDTKTLARAYNNLQEVEYESGSYAKALLLLDSAVKYTAPDNNYDLRIIYFDKAEVLLNLKQYDAAIVCANKTLELDDSVGNKADKSDTYFLLSQILQAKGDYKKAFEYNELARKITDSIFSVQRTANVAELEKKYSQQKNETTIQELEKKKQLYLLLSISGLLSLIVIALFFRQQSLKNKKNVLETEQRLNRARMNPHFFFNSLMALQKFALKEKNNMVLASNLSKYSKLMRATLESTYKEYTTIEDEVEFLEEYFQVQQVRFEKPFAYEIKVAEDIEVDELQIPSMIIQPFVENTLEHGFVNVQDAGKIVIHFYKTNNSLNIEIIDNGAGIYGNKNNNEHISRATQIIKDRIYLLNLKHQSNASFSVNNNDKGVGVIVKINLPLLYKGTS